MSLDYEIKDDEVPREESLRKSSGRRIYGGVVYAILLTYILGPSTVMAKPKKEKVRQVFIEEVTRVEGKIQKPEVWYLLPRSNLNFEGIKKNKKLTPKIEKATKEDIFNVIPRY